MNTGSNAQLTGVNGISMSGYCLDVAKMSLFMSTIWPFREGVLLNLNATECSLLMKVLKLQLDEFEVKRYLDPYRDLEPLFPMRAALTRIGYDIVLIGAGISDLFSRIQDPVAHWSFDGDENITLWLVVQRSHHATFDKESLVGWAMRNLRPELHWYTYLLGSVGLLFKRERIKLVVTHCDYPPVPRPADTDYSWYVRPGITDDEEFQDLLEACANESAPASKYGLTRFSVQSNSVLESKLFSDHEKLKTYAMNLNDIPAVMTEITSNNFASWNEGEVCNKLVWFTEVQAVIHLSSDLATGYGTSFES